MMRMVAFLDGSLYARSVVDHAAWLSSANGRGVDLVQIVSPNELLASQVAPVHPGGVVVLDRDESFERQVADIRQKATTQLEQARDILASRGVSDVRVRLLEGNIPDLLAEEASRASVVILGKRGEHADLARLPLGSNFERLVRECEVPMLAVSRTFRPVNRMLIAVDPDSSSASPVETIAAGLLPRMPAQLLHVGSGQRAGHPELREASRRLFEVGYEVSTEIAEGSPRVVVPEHVVSSDIDLLALGVPKGSWLKSLIFGSLSSELIRACQIPILLCR